MSFLSAFAESKFAKSLFAAAGLDFAAFLKAGDENALKTLIESKWKPSEQEETAVKELMAEREKNLAEISTLKASVASLGAKVTSFESLGYKAAELVDEKGSFSDSKLKAADTLRIAAEARKLLAASGHQPLAEPVVEDPATTKKPAVKATGLALTISATRFQAPDKK
jgi:hypothetical protein